MSERQLSISESTPIKLSIFGSLATIIFFTGVLFERVMTLERDVKALKVDLTNDIIQSEMRSNEKVDALKDDLSEVKDIASANNRILLQHFRKKD